MTKSRGLKENEREWEMKPGQRTGVAHLVRVLGEGVTFEQVLSHLREDGLACTRDEYEAAWSALYAGEDALGRLKRPPGCARAAALPRAEPDGEPEEEPEPAAVPAESEGDVSGVHEANGHATAEVPGINRLEASRRLRELVREMGPDATAAQNAARAAEAGLPHSPAAVTRARVAAFGHAGKGRRTPAPAAKPSLTPDPSPTPQPEPADQAADLLALVAEQKRRLGELKRVVEAAGGTMRCRIEVSFSEEV